MELQKHALYQVATKALIFNADRILALTTPDGYLDFPGGRVDESERDIPWEEALKREVSEEVGESVKLDIGKTCFVSKRQYNKDGTEHHIAAIYFECQFKGGDITLSEEHGDFAWMTPSELVAQSAHFISVDEQHKIKEYFSEF